MNQGWTYRDQVDETGQTVLDFFTQRYRHSTQLEWQARLTGGLIHLDGQPTTGTTRLKAGQVLTYHRPPWQEPPVPLDFTLVYQDPWVWVVAKPNGLPVLPGGGFVEHTLLHQLQVRYPDCTVRPVHRLGRGTSGLLLLATPPARAHLSQQLREGKLFKSYRALVTGHPPA
ncbi:pseudouridine synthase, partial [Candidatus Cyanaurora vandensis]|uniref:pseudouridine synthase n=1 Tax=Candidatus Cyanaurora vandensis TaxID=2714958 RepID=UPI00257D1329